uniref:Uncharacterized protein n=1 Tax=Romanomermis culicivorax TaxID=13658 RepID=A0A915JYB8_ROMCU
MFGYSTSLGGVFGIQASLNPKDGSCFHKKTYHLGDPIASLGSSISSIYYSFYHKTLWEQSGKNEPLMDD